MGSSELEDIGSGDNSGSYTEDSLEEDTTYTFYLRDGSTTGSDLLATTDCSTSSSTSALEAPTASCYSYNPGEMSISFSTVEGATSYKIYRCQGECTPTTLVKTTNSGWTDTGLLPSTKYSYRMKASNSEEDSDFGNTVTCTTLMEVGGPPPTPTEFSLEIVEDDIYEECGLLTWSSSADTEWVKVYYCWCWLEEGSCNCDPTFQGAHEKGEEEALICLQPGTRFKMYITAENEYGESEPTETISYVREEEEDGLWFFEKNFEITFVDSSGSPSDSYSGSFSGDETVFGPGKQFSAYIEELHFNGEINSGSMSLTYAEDNSFNINFIENKALSKFESTSISDAWKDIGYYGAEINVY